MSGVEIDVVQVRAVADKLAEHYEAINDRMHQLMDQLAALPQAWQGPAADDFEELRTGWDERAAAHLATLRNVPDYLSAVRKAFTGTDDVGGSSITRIGSEMDVRA